MHASAVKVNSISNQYVQLDHLASSSHFTTQRNLPSILPITVFYAGQYSLVEPDGSVRTVDYVADWATGFHANVRNDRHHH
jgi:uncharacterized protein YcbX